MDDEQLIVLPHNYTPRSYQLPAWEALDSGRVKRGCCVWHRRAGKDLFAINFIAKKMMQRRGLYWHTFPKFTQGRRIAWDGFTREGAKFIDAFPEPLVEHRNNNEMRIELKPDTGGAGSIYQVMGTDDPDRLIGANPIGVVFSEYSVADPSAWKLIQPILKENGGWALFIYTPRGHNHGWELLEIARRFPQRWFCQVLTVNDTKRPDGLPVVSAEDVQEDRDDGMEEEMVQQEYYCSFEAGLVGSYYGPQMAALRASGAIGHYPVDPMKPVNTYWDIGMSDSTAIIFGQEYPGGPRIVDYYEKSGEGLPHYAKILKDKDYNYGINYAPHDINVRDFSTGESRVVAARKLGITFRVLPKSGFAQGIEATRAVLPMCQFNLATTLRLVNALSQYKKEWDEKLKVFADKPNHDWTSHPADAFRTLGMSWRSRPDFVKKRQTKAEDEWNSLAIQ